jgi:hypothetical protein
MVFTIGIVQAEEDGSLNFVTQSTIKQTNEVTMMSAAQQLSMPINITLLDHGTGEPIKSFALSTASQSETTSTGRYDVLAVQGTEEIILNNNGIELYF